MEDRFLLSSRLMMTDGLGASLSTADGQAKLSAICDDLVAERADLSAVIQTAGGSVWEVQTPALGWSVLDQLVHLAWFDEATTTALRDPSAFRAHRSEVLADVDGFVARVTRDHRGRSPDEITSWLNQTGEELVGVARRADPLRRVPWYGPDMTPTSMITARIMETWAHGQDVVDALHVIRPATERLRHVAFIGWRALANSFRAHGRPVPDAPVRVELGAWSFGPADAANVVRGSAVDFCLLVTQRRHRDDTDLVAEGPVASEWMTIAQAFAGPPGTGRKPGQFG